MERAAVFAKVYCKKDGTPISDGVRDKIVSPISLVDYMFCFLCVICFSIIICDLGLL